MMRKRKMQVTNFFKSMNNNIGKAMENVGNRANVRLVIDAKKIKN